MAVTVNNVIIAGNLTRDPQVRFLANEKAVANFGLAINNRFKTADGTMKEDTVFVDVEAWGRTAELVGQYLTKGRSCLVQGRLKMDNWEKDGVKHSKIRITADHVQFLDGGQRSQEGGAGAEASDRREPAMAAAGAAAPGRPASPSQPPIDDEPPF